MKSLFVFGFFTNDHLHVSTRVKIPIAVTIEI